MPSGSGVEWAECSLIKGTGCRVKTFSLILDSSVGLSTGIHSAGDPFWETPWVRILHSAEEDNLSPFDSKILSLYQSIEISNTKYVIIVCLPMSIYHWKYTRHQAVVISLAIMEFDHTMYYKTEVLCSYWCRRLIYFWWEFAIFTNVMIDWLIVQFYFVIFWQSTTCV